MPLSKHAGMPTYDEEHRFRREWDRLSASQQAAFMVAVQKLVEDLRGNRFRKGLRVKPYRGQPGTWEQTWADDGRAPFRFGEPIRPGHAHIIWMRIGTHDIFDES